MKKIVISILMFLLIIEISFVSATIIIPDYNKPILNSLEDDKISEEEIIEEPKTNNEIISKRTYNSRTFKNSDGTYTAEINSGRIFFYDGNQFVELEKLSNPIIEKKEITLDKIPNTNIFDFGTYTLHEGLTANIENHELVLKDANNETIIKLPRPFSTDANGNILENDYIINQNENILEIFVMVKKEWLKNSNYPIIVDPDTTLSTVTGIYDGHVSESIGPISRSDTLATINIGTNFAGDESRGFIEFDTSSILDTVMIDGVELITTVSFPFCVTCTIDITSFEGKKIEGNIIDYENLPGGNSNLFNHIGTGQGTPLKYVIGSTLYRTSGTKTISLGPDANDDLQNQLTGDYFGIGLLSTGATTRFESNEGIFGNRPKLIVTYRGACDPPTGSPTEWIIDGVTCTITTSITAIKGIIIRNEGKLIIESTGEVRVNSYISNPNKIQLQGSGTKIIIRPGGKLIQADSFSS